MEEEKVVLVNSDNSVLGTMGKLQAHQEGLLHRAFSVFIFNTNGQLLLQQRALEKYHSPGKWTNTCCSHPRFQEEMIDGAKRRLLEEMGMTCELDFAFDFIYKAALDQGLIEHELDFVFVGISDQLPRLNKDEVLAFKYVVMEDLENDLQHHESNYTAWLKICFPKVKEHYQKLFKDGRLDR